MRNGISLVAAEAAVFRFAVAGAPLGVERTCPASWNIPCRVVWGSVVLRKVLCRSKAWASASGQAFCVCGSKAPTHTLLLAQQEQVRLVSEHPVALTLTQAVAARAGELQRAQNSRRQCGLSGHARAHPLTQERGGGERVEGSPGQGSHDRDRAKLRAACKASPTANGLRRYEITHGSHVGDHPPGTLLPDQLQKPE